MRRSSRWQHWLVLISFIIAAAALFVASNYTETSSPFYDLTRSIAEALIVSVVVSLAVEPRLLRYFGNELASQTFWASFYSRAPDSFKEAIKELASTDQFSVAAHWTMNFDWADEGQSVIRLSLESVLHRENRSSKPHAFSPNNFIYESQFPQFTTEVNTYSVTCQDPAFYSDVMKGGFVRIEHSKDGRLLILPAGDRNMPIFEAPPGRRYTVITSATTYVGPTGHFPLVMVRPTLKSMLRFGGSALPDLYLSIMCPNVGTISTVIEGSGQELSAKGDIQIGEVAITGQSILVSWKCNSN